MGTIDSQNVWIYDNNDHMTPHATFMNLGQQSISDALAALRAELTLPDTGWINLPLSTSVEPVSGFTPQYRKIGDIVYIAGRVTHIQGSFQIGTLPEGFRPTNSINDMGSFPINDSAWRRIYIGSGGAVTAGSIQNSTSTQANFYCSFVAN